LRDQKSSGIFRNHFNKIELTLAIIFFLAMLLVSLSSTQLARAMSVPILSDKGYLGGGSAYYIYGEFQNLESSSIWIHNITTTYYDSNNNVLVVKPSVSCRNPVLPNEKSSFWTILWDSDESKNLGPKVDHYTNEIAAEYVYNVTRPELKTASNTTETLAGGIMHFTGEIENIGTSTANFTQVYLTCYDSNGKVVYVQSTTTTLSNIPAGQRSPYQFYCTEPELTALITRYSIIVDADTTFTFTVTPSEKPSEQPPSQNDRNDTSPAMLYTVWSPPHENAVVATALTAAAVGAVAIVTAAASNPSSAAGKVGDKFRDLLPEGAKKWLEEFISSKNRGTAKQKTGSPFVPTKAEAIAYIVSLVALTIGFSYVKVTSITQILLVLPTILATAVIIEVAKTYSLEVVSRRMGIWAEHKIWYFGIAMFIVTTFGFGLPFSTPSRNEYHSTQSTKRLNAIVASAAILITLAFAAIFFGLLISGFILIGSTGLAMCIILGFIDSFPVAPMNGKEIYQYKKAVWAAFFVFTLAIYVSWLLFF
jgi:hypothetical protein